MMIILVTLIVGTIVIGFLGGAHARSELLQILWLIGAFVLCNGWFILFEMGGRGATSGKRLLGLRVIHADRSATRRSTSTAFMRCKRWKKCCGGASLPARRPGR